MNMKPQAMNIANMVYATERSKDRVKQFMDLAARITADSERSERKTKQECVACFYIVGRIGGAAITKRPCMSCGLDQMYGSTNTDVLCIECAHKHNLCKHCGGDVDMKVRRKNWPVADATHV